MLITAQRMSFKINSALNDSRSANLGYYNYLTRDPNITNKFQDFSINRVNAILTLSAVLSPPIFIATAVHDIR